MLIMFRRIGTNIILTCLCLLIFTSSIAVPVLQSTADSNESSDPAASDPKLLGRFVYHARRPHAEPSPHLKSDTAVEDHFHVYPFVFRNIAKRNRTTQPHSVRQTGNSTNSPSTPDPTPSNPSATPPAEAPQNATSESQSPIPTPAASTDASPTPLYETKANETAHSPSPSPIQTTNPMNISEQGKPTSQPTESTPYIQPTPNSNSNNDNTGSANASSPKSTDAGDNESSESDTKGNSSSGNMVLNAKLFKSPAFLIGAGVVVVIVLAAAYFSFRSGICNGRRRTGTEQPYEIVDQDEISGQQATGVNISGQQGVDADGWNDGWDNDDWEVSDGRSKD